ncbi:MAG: hypothetical protein E7326_08615 [Clostridiales bacterium]|nr:hypothetical protein [Clostridiales bacterium]
MKRVILFIAGMLLMCMLCAAAYSEEIVTASEMRMEGAEGSFVACPLLTVPEDETLSAAVNQLIQEKGRIAEYTAVLSQITEGSTGLTVSYTMTDVQRPVVSLVFSANGKMPFGKPSQKYHPVVMDMETGAEVTADSIFTDAEAALWALEEYMDTQVAQILSTHMENSDLLPIPMDSFALDEMGITFYYDQKQLSFLSGFSGAVTVPYFEMAEHLDLSDGSVLQRMGYAEEMMTAGAHTARKIAERAQSGYLGALPCQVGMTLDEAMDAFRSTVDAGFYPGGAYYEMEDASLRDAVLLTDAAETKVIGIHARRISLWGIETGKTTREEWQKLLGEAQFSMEMGESDGSMYLLCPGVSDFYDFGDFTLQLHADENGVLYAAVLKE